jgi:hypothetical protein
VVFSIVGASFFFFGTALIGFCLSDEVEITLSSLPKVLGLLRVSADCLDRRPLGSSNFTTVFFFFFDEMHGTTGRASFWLR